MADSGAPYTKPIRDSNIFNETDFINENEPSSLSDNDSRYLRLIGGALTGVLTSSSTIHTTDIISNQVTSDNCLYLRNDKSTPIEVYSDTDEYSLILHNYDNTNAKQTGLAFLNGPANITTGAPSASITTNKTGTNGNSGLCFATKKTTSCIERMRIDEDGLIGVNTVSAALQFEVNHATGSCMRLRYNDSATAHTDLLLNSDGALLIQSPEYTEIITAHPSQLVLQKTADHVITDTDTCEFYPLTISADLTSNDKQVGIAFNHTVNNLTHSPGAAITFVRKDLSGVGDLIFQTKEVDSTIADCFERMRINSDGLVGIATNAPIYPLHVNKTTSVDIPDYGYVNSSGDTGTTTSGTPNNYSIYTTGRIACTGEVDCISDRRVKTNIEPLNIDYCKSFLEKTTPVMYNYINELDKKSTGYIAQDIHKAGFTDLISLVANPDMNESTDSDGFVNPQGLEFTISTGEIIPILQVLALGLLQRVESLEEDVALLKNIKTNHFCEGLPGHDI